MNTTLRPMPLRSDHREGTDFRPLQRERTAPAYGIAGDHAQAASVKKKLPLYAPPEISSKRQRLEAQAGTLPCEGTSIIEAPDTVRLELAQQVVRINQKIDRVYEAVMTPEEILKLPMAKLMAEETQHLGTVSADKVLRYVNSSMARRRIIESHPGDTPSTTPIAVSDVMKSESAKVSSLINEEIERFNNEGMEAADDVRTLNEYLTDRYLIPVDHLQDPVPKKIGRKRPRRAGGTSTEIIDLNAKPRLPRDISVPRDIAQKIADLLRQGNTYPKIAKILKDDPICDWEIPASRVQSFIEYHLSKGPKPRLPAGELPEDMQSDIARRFSDGQGYYTISKSMNTQGNYPYEITPSRVQWYLKQRGWLPS